LKLSPHRLFSHVFLLYETLLFNNNKTSGIAASVQTCGGVFPLAIQPVQGPSFELPILPHTPFHQPAIDVCIHMMHTALGILSTVSYPATHLRMKGFRQLLYAVGTPM